MAGQDRGAGRAGDPTWWSADSPPDELPSWARRGLSESPELAPSAPVTPSGRRRRVVPAGSRLRGWGLAVASVAAAAAAVPLAVSTLASSEDAYSLPRVGTFPVVAPGSLDPGPDVSVGRAPAERGPTADAGTLPPLQDPLRDASVVRADPPPPVAPRAVTRPRPTTTAPTRATAPTPVEDTPTEVDATPARAPGGGTHSGTAGDRGGDVSPPRGGGGDSSDGGDDHGSSNGPLDVLDSAVDTVNGVAGLAR